MPARRSARLQPQPVEVVVEDSSVEEEVESEEDDRVCILCRGGPNERGWEYEFVEEKPCRCRGTSNWHRGCLRQYLLRMRRNGCETPSCPSCQQRIYYAYQGASFRIGPALAHVARAMVLYLLSPGLALLLGLQPRFWWLKGTPEMKGPFNEWQWAREVGGLVLAAYMLTMGVIAAMQQRDDSNVPAVEKALRLPVMIVFGGAMAAAVTLSATCVHASEASPKRTSGPSFGTKKKCTKIVERVGRWTWKKATRKRMRIYIWKSSEVDGTELAALLCFTAMIWQKMIKCSAEARGQARDLNRSAPRDRTECQSASPVTGAAALMRGVIFILLFVCAIWACAYKRDASCPDSWNYDASSSSGPAGWSSLCSGFSTCNSG